MAKVFRKFRERLFGGSKLSKYLLYALGEILLVVIGILIALQINNKSSYDNERKEEFRLLKKFSSDFKQDSLALEFLIKSETQVLQNIDSIYRILESKSESNLLKLVNLSIILPNSNIFYSKTGTYDEAIAAGKMDFVLNDSLRETIFNYYVEIKVNLSDKVFDKYQTSEIVPSFMKIMLQNKQAMKFSGLENPYLESLSVNGLYKNPEFNKILAWRKINATFSIGTWKLYLESCSEILHQVNKEIEIKGKDN